jgi:hypothetical protein
LARNGSVIFYTLAASSRGRSGEVNVSHFPPSAPPQASLLRDEHLELTTRPNAHYALRYEIWTLP